MSPDRVFQTVRECLPPSVVNGVTRPPPLPAKPSCVPAVPARRGPPPVIVASPTSDTATSSDDDDGGGGCGIGSGGGRETAIEPPRIPARSNVHRLTKMAAPEPEDSNAAETPSSSTGTEDSQRDVAERAADADEESCGEEQQQQQQQLQQQQQQKQQQQQLQHLQERGVRPTRGTATQQPQLNAKRAVHTNATNNAIGATTAATTASTANFPQYNRNVNRSQ